MTNDELEDILHDRYDRWIKVPRYDGEDKESCTFDDFWDLLDHHKRETTFLINKCKELAAILKVSRDEYDAIRTFNSSMREVWIQQGRNELEREQRGY